MTGVIPAGYYFTLFPDGRMTCRLGHEVPPGEENAHLHNERVDLPRAFAEGMDRLLAAVEALPAPHDCGGRLRWCEDHPKWRVLFARLSSRGSSEAWYSIPPGPETYPVPDEHRHASLAAAHTLATERARAAQLAAVQSGEGAGR